LQGRESFSKSINQTQKRKISMKRISIVLAMLCALAVGYAMPHPSTAAQNVVADGHFKFIRADNSVRELRFDVRNEAGGQHLIRVNYYDGAGSVLATPIRFKLAGDRLAADNPGCDPNEVVTDANSRITDG
jgi:hypothetical protein